MPSREYNFTDIPNCPELHPSLQEFSSFQTYIQRVEQQYSQDYGMVKIIPPKEWKARQSDYDNSIDTKMILGPIEQNPQGKGGIYECIHITKKSIPFGEFKKRSIKFDKVTEGMTNQMVEALFWKNISFSPPLYGSDMEMSLFDQGAEWNLKELKSILNDGLTSLIPGVNTPYLYIGSWKTLFAWHKEDLDLGAINYLHHGKPKYWYTISRSDSEKLEKEAKSHFSESFAKCPQFLRHKTVIINPYHLVNKYAKDIKISKTAQNQGEFIIVFNGAYHHGFNQGYNIAEAVNYASLSWLKIFPQSQLCNCSSDCVNIDHQEFLETLLKNRPDLKNSSEVKEFKDFIKEKKKEQKLILQEMEKEEEEEECLHEVKELKKRGRKPKELSVKKQPLRKKMQPKIEMKKSMIKISPKKQIAHEQISANQMSLPLKKGIQKLKSKNQK